MADDLFARMWAARPWKDYATNPPSMAPQLGIALGLLGPRVMGAPMPRQAPAPLPELKFPERYWSGNDFPMKQEALNAPFIRHLRANPPTPANQNIRLGLIE